MRTYQRIGRLLNSMSLFYRAVPQSHGEKRNQGEGSLQPPGYSRGWLSTALYTVHIASHPQLVRQKGTRPYSSCRNSILVSGHPLLSETIPTYISAR